MAKNTTRRVVGWIVVLALVAGVWALIAWKGNRPKELDAIRARRGSIEAFFREPARTRLLNTYRIPMPIDGRIRRISLEPGDNVTAGQKLVAFDRLPLEEAVKEARAAVAELAASVDLKKDQTLEATAHKQTVATVIATEETVKSAKAEVEAARARADRAEKERKRMEALVRSQHVPETKLDDARLNAETSLIALREKQFSLAASNAMLMVVKLMPQLIDEYIGKKALEAKVVEQQLKQAEARLTLAEHHLALAKVVSPIAGKVLERYEQGDRSLSAGQPLLLLGDLKELEVIADVLTEDALKLVEGKTKVDLLPTSGGKTLLGTVKRIEPQGFTKLSSLGVEQQRVNVIVAFDAAADLSGLGVDYRLQARFYTGVKTETLILPRSAVMQSPEGEYYVFTIVDGELKKQTVILGLKSERELEITDGITESDDVIARPDATMKEEMKVKVKAKE